MKKVLIIDGHPDDKSFCQGLAKAYFTGAVAAKNDVKTLSLRELNFELSLRNGYRVIQELEDDLKKSQELIAWAEHVVIVYPIWWGSMPALLKGFLDRVLLPGFAFKYRKNSPLWDKLLKGRSAHIIVTSDAPYWYNLVAYLGAPYRAMKKGVLEFCGFSPVKMTSIGSVKNLNGKKREQWLNKVMELGEKGT